MTYISDANDRATVLADANTFFTCMGYFKDSDPDEAAAITADFTKALNTHTLPPYWGDGATIAALIQVYDLVLPLDLDQALTLLSRLGAYAGALLANRDDKSDHPEDPFRGHVMAAWGGYTSNRDNQWNTDVSTSGLFAYGMAAFARRVVDRPDLYPQFHDQAIALITATIETYQAFRPELHLVDGDPFAYYVLPWGYGILNCTEGGDECIRFRQGAGKQRLAYNQNLSMMQALAELALAANSNIYRASADATQLRMDYATKEAPIVIARNVAWFVAGLRAKNLPDRTPYYEWDYIQGGEVENEAHGQFELGCLAVILADQPRLNALLASDGQADRIPLSSSMFVRFANTFLRIVSQGNHLSDRVDGSWSSPLSALDGSTKNNRGCAGWLPQAQFDPTVWTRSRDTIFYTNPPSLFVDNHAALLRYREFNAMQYLTDFAGQNWLITPAALAVGENPPKDILDQKWLLVLSGVVASNLKGASGGWSQQTVSFVPDMAGTDDPTSISGPLNWAISHYNIPRPPGTVGTQYRVRFSLDDEGWSPFVTLGSIYDQAQSVNAGFAVNDWRPNPFESGTDAVTGQPVNNIFTGVVADIAVSDSDAWLYKLNYNITLLGKIVYIKPPVIY